MRLTDYVKAPKELKKQYFDTLTMQVGLRYFGGKATIGKYLINRVMEMQAYRYNYDEPAKYFVDCFTGGGKMALTIPTGWFDTIVMNDLNYGVYSYYKCCQSKPLALIKMIENLGKIMCYDVFMICAQERSNEHKFLTDDILEGLGLSNYKGTLDIESEMLLSAAMTYWVTQGSWLGETDPDKITYALNTGTKSENEEIKDVVKRARKYIMNINQKMTRQKYIVENMDYVDLIKTYGFDSKGNKKEEVIWYLDPPYHEATLNKSNGIDEDRQVNVDVEDSQDGKPAPYEDSFLYEQTMAMTYLLSNMKWFIKSDYDPYHFFVDPIDDIIHKVKVMEEKRLTGEIKELPEILIDKPEKLEPYQIWFSDKPYYHDFDLIENLKRGFYREELGRFHKGTSTGHDEGREVIWSRYDGSIKSLINMGVTEGDVEFWEDKVEKKQRWDDVHHKLYNFEKKILIAKGIDKKTIEQRRYEFFLILSENQNNS